MSLAGKLSWTDSDNIAINAEYDRLALLGELLMMVSCVGSAQDIKAFRAGLNSKLDARISLGTATVTCNGDKSHVSSCVPATGGYLVLHHRLPFGMVHAIAICRMPGLLLNGSAENLWCALKSERYTTPLLRSWMPYITEELIARELLQDCSNLECSCKYLSAITAQLDSIVEDGLKAGAIFVREGAA